MPALSSAAYHRRCQRVLKMLHELHSRGLQRLRFASGPEPGGRGWQIFITPAHYVRMQNQQIYPPLDPTLSAEHRSSWGEAECYFRWEDVAGLGAKKLADRFVQRFPKLCLEGHGKDWAYAGWFSELLGIAENGCLPLTNNHDQHYLEFKNHEVHWWGEDLDTGPPFPPAPIMSDHDEEEVKIQPHWSEDRYWTDGLDSYVKYRNDGNKTLTLDIPSIEAVAFQCDGPAYRLEKAMESVTTLEDDGGKGAPRLMLALLMRLQELGPMGPGETALSSYERYLQQPVGGAPDSNIKSNKVAKPRKPKYHELEWEPIESQVRRHPAHNRVEIVSVEDLEVYISYAKLAAVVAMSKHKAGMGDSPEGTAWEMVGYYWADLVKKAMAELKKRGNA